MISLIQHLSYKSVIARPYNTERTRQADLADQEGGKKTSNEQNSRASKKINKFYHVNASNAIFKSKPSMGISLKRLHKVTVFQHFSLISSNYLTIVFLHFSNLVVFKAFVNMSCSLIFRWTILQINYFVFYHFVYKPIFYIYMS